MKKPTLEPADLRRARRQLGLTQVRLAAILAVSRVTYNRFENDRLVKGIPDWVKPAMERVIEAFRENAAMTEPEELPAGDMVENNPSSTDAQESEGPVKNLWPEEDDE